MQHHRRGGHGDGGRGDLGHDPLAAGEARAGGARIADLADQGAVNDADAAGIEALAMHPRGEGGLGRRQGTTAGQKEERNEKPEPAHGQTLPRDERPAQRKPAGRPESAAKRWLTKENPLRYCGGIASVSRRYMARQGGGLTGRTVGVCTDWGVVWYAKVGGEWVAA